MNTILAIDDQKDNLIIIKAVIKNGLPKCKLITALSGEEAIKLAKEELPDTILLDIIMPEMDGYEATKQIREFNKEVIIIAQTANALTGDREKSIAAGCNDYITKPIKKDELFRKIEKLIESGE